MAISTGTLQRLSIYTSFGLEVRGADLRQPHHGGGRGADGMSVVPHARFATGLAVGPPSK